MKNFCTDLKEHAAKIINYEKKMIPLTKEEKKVHRQQKIFVIYAKKDLVLIMMTIKNTMK